MLILLSSVRKLQTDSLAVFGEVEARVAAARRAIQFCNGPPGAVEVRGSAGVPGASEIQGDAGIDYSPGSVALGATRARPSIPSFGVTRSGDSSYSSFPGRCDHYPDVAETAARNARRNSAFLARHAPELDRMIDFLAGYCEDWALRGLDRTSLGNALTSLLGSAAAARDRFARYVADVERFNQQYEDCLADEEAGGALLPMRH
jgi:hypothetical protein